MGKYENLGRHLIKFTENMIEYRFEQIENILGFPLPESAKLYRSWWSNDKTHVQAWDGWMKYGWSLDFVDFSKKIVRFRKKDDASVQKENISLSVTPSNQLTASQFEEFARIIMSDYYNQTLFSQKINPFPKLFDLVSQDRTIIGDAKYLTMVRGTSIPPAKFATIAEYVWLLEKTNAKNKFLVFGNDKNVPLEWLKRYGSLVTDVDFYFIDIETKKVEKLERR